MGGVAPTLASSYRHLPHEFLQMSWSGIESVGEMALEIKQQTDRQTNRQESRHKIRIVFPSADLEWSVVLPLEGTLPRGCSAQVWPRSLAWPKMWKIALPKCSYSIQNVYLNIFFKILNGLLLRSILPPCLLVWVQCLDATPLSDSPALSNPLFSAAGCFLPLVAKWDQNETVLLLGTAYYRGWHGFFITTHRYDIHADHQNAQWISWSDSMIHMNEMAPVWDPIKSNLSSAVTYSCSYVCAS